MSETPSSNAGSNTASGCGCLNLFVLIFFVWRLILIQDTLERIELRLQHVPYVATLTPGK